MIDKAAYPDIETARVVAAGLLKEDVLDAQRLITGRKNFVVAITTSTNEFVIRMTTKEHKNSYVSAIYWQNKLLPLGVPLAKFIAIDLEGQYSPYPTLIMLRAPGNDLCNVYSNLSVATKQTLARQMVNIHHKTEGLALASQYGFANSYEDGDKYQSWYEFLIARLEICQQSLNKVNIFPQGIISKILAIANTMQSDLLAVKARPFMWDTSERNVMVDHDQITAIIDVDNMCFGDPLFVLGLTYVALESLGFDTIYPDFWLKFLNLDHKAQQRLLFYRLFYTVWSMRSYVNAILDGGTPDNARKDLLNHMFIITLKKLG